MPLPKPKDKEKRKEFIERCMADTESVSEFEQENQRFAVCNDLWSNKDNKEEISMDNSKEKKPVKKETDHFDREDAAIARAGEIGCTGTHRMRDKDGNVFYMPCGSHEEYEEAIGKSKDKAKAQDTNKAHEDKDCCDGVCMCDKTSKIIFEAEIKSDEKGVFSGYASTFGNVDQGNDIIAKGAFTKSLSERPAHKVKLLSQHKTDEPIGIFETMYEDDKGLYVKGKLAMGTQRGSETYELLKLGAIDGMSIGFRADPQKQSYNEAKRVRTLKEVELLEISLVTFPMNEQAVVRSVKGNKNIREWETILRDAGGLSRTEAKIGAKALMDALNHRDDDETKQLANLIQRVADILNK